MYARPTLASLHGCAPRGPPYAPRRSPPPIEGSFTRSTGIDTCKDVPARRPQWRSPQPPAARHARGPAASSLCRVGAWSGRRGSVKGWEWDQSAGRFRDDDGAVCDDHLRWGCRRSRSRGHQTISKRTRPVSIERRGRPAFRSIHRDAAAAPWFGSCIALAGAKAHKCRSSMHRNDPDCGGHEGVVGDSPRGKTTDVAHNLCARSCLPAFGSQNKPARGPVDHMACLPTSPLTRRSHQIPAHTGSGGRRGGGGFFHPAPRFDFGCLRLLPSRAKRARTRRAARTAARGEP